MDTVSLDMGMAVSTDQINGQSLNFIPGVFPPFSWHWAGPQRQAIIESVSCIPGPACTLAFQEYSGRWGNRLCAPAQPQEERTQGDSKYPPASPYPTPWVLQLDLEAQLGLWET